MNIMLRHKLLLTASAAMMLSASPAIAAESDLPAEDQADVMTTVDAAVSETAVDESTAEGPVAEEPANQEPAGGIEASNPKISIGDPISMDRSDWPVVGIGPADGSVTHNPTYMGKVPMGEDEVSPLHAPDPVWQIQEALRGATAENYSDENTGALITQPFIGLAQFVLIPFEAVIEHPWSEVTSE